MRYFGGHDQGVFMPSANTFSSNSNFTTATVFIESDTGINSYMIQFVRGATKDDFMDAYAKAVEEDWNTKIFKDKGWSAWGDFHDGLADYNFNLAHAHMDNMQFVRTTSVLRAYVPGTAWTIELREAEVFRSDEKNFSFPIGDASDLEYLENHSWTIDEPCRNMTSAFHNVYMENDAGFWWKATFAAADAEAAAAFAIEVLGARESPCPFPYPPTETCSGARWLTVGPDLTNRFELHFVELFQDHDTINEYHESHARRVAALTAGCLDASLFDSVSFYVHTLDPFVEKLKSKGVPYMLAKVAPGRHVLFFAFPGNEAIGIQLHSDLVTASATVTSLEPCAEEILPHSSFLQQSLILAEAQESRDRVKNSSTESILPLYFFHIPKAGGTEFQHVIVASPGVCWNLTDADLQKVRSSSTHPGEDSRHLSLSQDVESICHVADLRWAGIVFNDHSGISNFYSSHVQGHTVALFRQPEQRILSGYSDSFHSWPLRIYGRWPSSLLEYAEVTSGCAVKMLTRTGASAQKGQNDTVCGQPEKASERETELAIRRLQDGFRYVGILEEWALSICLWHSMFGGSCGAFEFQSANSANMTADISELEGFVDVSDGQLYTAARKIFDNSLESYGVSMQSCSQGCFSEAGYLQ